ncbi:MAG: hypothetical protein GX163_01945 [Bacteroidetes bacterium]|nr:hypothetical protein [Bacteroidota bacterium]
MLVNADDEELREKASYYRLDDYRINIPQAINEIEIILDNLCRELLLGGVDSISHWLLDCLNYNGKSIGFETIVKFWAYIIRHKFQLSEETVTAWLRIEKHLIENSEYNTKNISNAIRSINKINDFSENLIGAFAESKITGDLPPINSDMIIEETQKAKLMLSNFEWNEAILNAESELLYFNGQIGFLLDFSENELGQFKLYHRKTALIFDAKDGEGIPSEKQDAFRRALLTFGNYSVREDCFHFNAIVNSLRGGSWRDLLADSKSGKRGYFKDLPDNIKLKNGIVEQLRQFIDDFSLQDDWRYHFIKTDEVMAFMGYGMFKDREWNTRILLIPNRYVNGRGNAEYRTYSLFCILKANGICSEGDYQFNVSSGEMYFCIPQKDIKVVSRDGNSQLLFFQGDIQIAECGTVEEVLSLIETL